VSAPEAIATAPLWRREPGRFLFPLGVLLSWAGVGPWFLLGAFDVGIHRGVFHSMAQIQGFMMCFVAGFLFTALPRRTQSLPPAAWEMTVALVAPVGLTVAAWFKLLVVAQACWGVMVLMLLAFACRRLFGSSAGRRAPNCFVWIPASFTIAIAGAALIGVQRGLGVDWFWIHELGKMLILQGMLLGLVIGVGGLVFPLITHGDPPGDGAPSGRDAWLRAGHLLAAALLVGTFALEVNVSARLGLGLRAALVGALLIGVGRIWRVPKVPGWHRWLAWGSAWVIPLGYAVAAFDPARKQAGLHMVFVGGLGLLVLAVGAHVVLAHAGYQRTVRARNWEAPALGLLILVTVVARSLMILRPEYRQESMAVAAAAFLGATLVWLIFVMRRLLTTPGPDEAPAP